MSAVNVAKLLVAGLLVALALPVVGQDIDRRPTLHCDNEDPQSEPGMGIYVNGELRGCEPGAEPTTVSLTAGPDKLGSEPDGGASANTTVFTFTMTGSQPDEEFDVLFTVGGTADPPGGAAGDDYTMDPATITFAPGDLDPKTVTITPKGDSNNNEGTETVILTLTTPQDGSNGYLVDDANKTAETTIADHGPLLVAVEASDGQAVEGDAADAAEFTIRRTGKATGAITVNYELSGSAAQGADYDSPGTSVTLADQQSSAKVAIRARSDTEVEGTQIVTLEIKSIDGNPTDPDRRLAIGPPAAASIAILDEDLPSVKVTASAVYVVEGTAAAATEYFRFERSNTNGELTVQYTVSGSATSGADYAALNGQVVFADGQSGSTVSLLTLQDSSSEPVESVTVTVAAGTEYEAGLPTQATLSIVDDDQPTVAIAVEKENAFERLDGKTVAATFNLTRSAAGRTAALTVTYAVTGTAGAGDYAALAGTITFPPGRAYVLLNVTPVDDTTPEPAEQVTVTLQPGAYAIVAPGSGRVFINDDDGIAVGQDGDAIPASRDNCPSATNPDQLDSDSDGAGDACDSDDDDDGLSDDQERLKGTSPTVADTDHDGLSDPSEVAAGTDPVDRFSPDYRARAITVNATGTGVKVGWESSASSRVERFQVWRLSVPTLIATVPAIPNQVVYSFEDLEFPGGEHTYAVQAKLPGEEDVGYDPVVATASEPIDLDLCDVRTADADEDGLCDAREQDLGTNLYDTDSDSDGIDDGAEFEAGTDPLEPESTGEEDGTAFDFGDPVVWLGSGLLVLLVAALIVGVVLYSRRK